MKVRFTCDFFGQGQQFNSRDRSAFVKKIQYHVPLFALIALIAVVMACGCNCDFLPTQCGLTPDSGPCEAAFEKYFFDSEDQVCKPFIWGGCEGTVPFDTIEDCRQCECHGSSG